MDKASRTTSEVNPKIEQSLLILQMDNAQLNEYLTGKMLENPLIEMEAVSPDDSKLKLFQRKMDWLERQDENEEEQSIFFDPSIEHPEEKPAWPSYTLRESLREQLGKEKEQDLVYKIINYLDDNGYLTLMPERLAEETESSQEDVENAIDLIRSLKPAGVGAFTLSQCLKLQLPEESTLARSLAKKPIHDLREENWQALAQEEAVSVEEIKEAVHQLWKCSPRPGSACGREELPFYLTPDVLVIRFQDRYEVMLCEFNVPDISICQDYIDMAREQKDPELLKYIKSNLEQVQWLQQCVKTRGEAVIKVTRAILKRQERFLRYGPQYLRLVTVQQIADDLGMQKKTVERALKNKYLQCPYGVFPLHYFVLREEDDKTQSRIGRDLVKKSLVEILSKEKETAPYSDHKLMQILCSKGFDISARMVKHYREEMGIPDDQGRLNLKCGDGRNNGRVLRDDEPDEA